MKTYYDILETYFFVRTETPTSIVFRSPNNMNPEQYKSNNLFIMWNNS